MHEQLKLWFKLFGQIAQLIGGLALCYRGFTNMGHPGQFDIGSLQVVAGILWIRSDPAPSNGEDSP